MDIAAESTPRHRSHPAGLALLFGTEMLECFAYYGMRSLLVLYLIASPASGGLGWTTQEATQLYGLYTGLLFIAPIIGGYVSDRYLSPQTSVVLGTSIATIGYLFLGLGTAFNAGLGLVILGTGLLKPNVAVQVGHLYAPDDSRRDTGYTIFYLGMNVGALFGPLICGYLASRPNYGWQYGFGASALGTLLAFALFGTLKNACLTGAKQRAATNKLVSNIPLTPEEKQKLQKLFFLAIFVVFFWLAFEQTGSSMTLFAERNTDRLVPSWLQSLIGVSEFPTAWFQMINPTMILVCTPLLSMAWQYLGRRGYEPYPTTKMCIGLLLLAAGFLVLVFGAARADQGVLVSPLWLAATYLLHAWAESCFSPVGMSLVSRLAPAKFSSLMMAFSLICYGIANAIAGCIASTMESVQHGDYFTLLGGQADFFLIFVISSCLAGIFMYLLLYRTR